jgi:hypothetical protein
MMFPEYAEKALLVYLATKDFSFWMDIITLFYREYPCNFAAQYDK